jgi:hypothetical protein
VSVHLVRLKRWDGREVVGVASRGSGVFAALDWRDLALADGPPIDGKSRLKSRQLSAFGPEEQTELLKRDGRYCDLQSINSEDTVTWSVFGVCPIDLWAEDLLSVCFGPGISPGPYSALFWHRLPHPDTGRVVHGPEADVILGAGDGWHCPVEAKWSQDIGANQGRLRDKTQRQLRAAYAKTQLVIAPQPHHYRPAKNAQSVFATHFQIVREQYVPTVETYALGIRVITWEQIRDIMAERSEPEAMLASAYLTWRLNLLT